jgi:serine/threonine-protein kinase
MWEQEEEKVDPVYVIETIPVPGDHAVSADEIRKHRIPAPAHLRLSREIGRGAAGRIHVALDRNLLRHVALKRLEGRMAQVPMYRDGFIAEAQITGQLEHQNIVPVHELAIADNGVPYFTMKLVQGMPFNRWLADPWRPPGSTERIEQGVEILIKVCDALAYAHHRGVIHRDLKPQNIMVGEFGQVYLLDWGLARLTRTRPASGDQAQMEAHGPVGTPTHFAPEQARGNPAEVDERSEVFGIGALLYELVSGVPPYGKSRSGDEALRKAQAGEVIALDEAASAISVPPQLATIVMKAVAPDKAERYASIVDLQADLKRFLHGGLHLPTRTYAAGKTIVREGEVGNEAFMIARGSCRVYRDVNGEQETLVTLGPGDVFGEMALLLDEPRAASVEAADEVTVTVLDRQTMKQGVGTSGWTSALVRSLAERFHALEQSVRRSGMRRDEM